MRIDKPKRWMDPFGDCCGQTVQQLIKHRGCLSGHGVFVFLIGVTATFATFEEGPEKMGIRSKSICFALMTACLLPTVAMGQGTGEMMGCGTVQKQPGGYGPHDYRVDKDKLPMVEQHHFDAGVETFTKQKTGFFGGDIDYTLRAFPNHHRALMAMVNLGIKEKSVQPRGARYTVECYFVRAETYRPDDSMVKVIYGLYHLKHGRPGEAVKKLEEARAIAGDDANVHYNLGLAYTELKQYDKALKSAHVAYAKGFPLPGLRDRLRRAGAWRDLPQ